MVAEIKAKLVLDTSGGIGGAVSSGGTSSAGGGIGSAIMSKLTIPLTDVLSGILKGINKLVQASPVLAATMKEFHMGMRMLLMPIGETISTLLRPWIMKFNRVAFQFYDDYVTGGLWFALLEGMKNIFDEWGVSGILEAAGAIVITGALLKGGWSSLLAMIGKTFGLGAPVAMAGGGMGLAISAAIMIGAIEMAKAFGQDGFVGVLAGLLGIGASMLVGGITGALFGITVALSVILIAEAADIAQKKIFQWLVDVGAINPRFDQGITADIVMRLITDPEGLKKDKELREFLEDAPSKESIISGAKERKAKTGSVGSGAVMDVASDSMKSAMDKQARDSESIWKKAGRFITKIFMGAEETVSGPMMGSDKGLVGLPSALADSMETAVTERVVPSLMSIGNSSDEQVVKVKNLKLKVETLPDIVRTITYKIRYVYG